MHGPDWLISQEYPNQDNEVVILNELTVEINPINPVPPVIDLARHSTFTKAERVMFRLLQFLKSDLKSFETLVRQEQKLHCSSIFSHLFNPNVRVNVDVKNTIKELNLVLIDNTIRAKGRLEHAELPLDAKYTILLAKQIEVS